MPWLKVMNHKSVIERLSFAASKLHRLDFSMIVSYKLMTTPSAKRLSHLVSTLAL